MLGVSQHVSFSLLVYNSILLELECKKRWLSYRRHLEPGGYLEQIELVPYASCDDDSYRRDSIVNQICALRPALEQAFNTDYNLASNMKQMIQEAGFVDIEEKIIKVPWSPWHSPGTKEHEMGRIFQRFYETGLQGWIIAPLIRHHNVCKRTWSTTYHSLLGTILT